jgi:maleylpyruvate isomerase
VLLIVVVQLVGNTDAALPASFRSEVNDMAQVPVLEFTDTVTGAVHRLTQSVAIIEFLDDLVASPPLLPADPLARAQCRQIVELVNSGIQPMQNLSILRQVKEVELLHPDGQTALPRTDGKGFAKANIERGLASLERLVAGAASNGGRFAAGTDYPTVADLCVIPQLYNADRFAVDMAPFPTLAALNAFVADHPAFQVARPEAQSDAK